MYGQKDEFLQRLDTLKANYCKYKQPHHSHKMIAKNTDITKIHNTVAYRK